jgi:pyrimidine-specific ribonucleoside hydrolase
MKMKMLVFAVLLTTAVQAQTKVWFDTDLMIGMPDKSAREVDDGFTLIMALKQPQIEIVGISSITYVDYSYDVIQQLLKWHNKGAAIPVYKGSPNANDVGVENDGTRALYEALKKEKLTILALGPMTNIATLIQNHPDIIPQIEKISICAARTEGLPFDPGNGKLNVFDYNYEFDYHAMDVVLASPIPLVFAGYEPSSYTHIGPIDLASLDMNLEADKWLHDVVQPWMEKNEKFFGVKGFIPFDCSTLGVITHPDYFTYHKNIPIKVVYKKNDALQVQPNVPYKNFLEVSYKFKTKRKVDYAIKALPGFEEKILETLSVKN